MLADTFKTFLYGNSSNDENQNSQCHKNTQQLTGFAASTCPAEKLSHHSQAPTCAPTFYPLTWFLPSHEEEKESRKGDDEDFLAVHLLFLQCLQAAL